MTVAAPQPVGPFSVTCTHLHWKFHHSEVRERQVVVACDRVLARRRRYAFPGREPLFLLIFIEWGIKSRPGWLGKELTIVHALYFTVTLGLAMPLREEGR